MAEFRRLLESSPTPATRELLRAGVGDRPRREVAQRAALALGLGASVAAASTLASAAAAGAAAAGTAVGGASVGSGAAKSLGVAVIAKWLAVGMTAGVVAAGGAAAVRYEVARSAAVSSATDGAGVTDGAVGARTGGKSVTNGVGPQANRAEAEPNGVSAAANAASETNGASPAPNGASPAPNGAGGAPAPVPPAGTARAAVSDLAPQRPPSTQAPLPTPASGAIAREVAQIDAARRALAAGDPARALSELAQYERTRQTPTFTREAELLRIDAFAARGERARAAELARRYLTRFPDDAHAAKLRQEYAP